MKLIYCAIPSRISKKSSKIMDYVESKRCAPFNPFGAFPLERFEFGSIGREETIGYCKRIIGLCDELWVFGLSDGTIQEIYHAIKTKKPIKIVKDFDDEWKNKKDAFADKIKSLVNVVEL